MTAQYLPPGATGEMHFRVIGSESLHRTILVNTELVGGNIIGIAHELIANAADFFLVKTPCGFQIDGFKLFYLKEASHYPKTSLYLVWKDEL